MGQKITFILLFICQFSSAQFIEYYNMINEGEYQMYEGHYELAIVNFEMAFEMVNKPKARDYFCISKCYSQIREEDKMYLFLEKSIINGYKKANVEADSLWFTEYNMTKKFKNILKLKPDKNIHLLDEISQSKVKELNDKFDYKMLRFRYTSKKDTLSKKYITDKIKNDIYMSEIETMLINYILNHPFPTKHKDQRLFNILINFYIKIDSDYYTKIINQLKIELKKGHIPPLLYASLTNFAISGKSNSTIYGLKKKDINNNNLTVILENRKSIGLSIYFFQSPNYIKNYKPEPIVVNFKN